ncbi:hypothetical protein [Acetobacter estunensis]|uniref:hypothetical protein n=1 Tax=Acetobacter estunensis TaxID=104097 RepID=UPI001F54FD2B|nr:hypothetical protein [Acetobacter estunensis]
MVSSSGRLGKTWDSVSKRTGAAVRTVCFVVPFALAACAQQPAGVTAANPPGRIPPQVFPPGTVTESAPPSGVKLVNDPSAPLTTPLCGASAQEANAMGQALYPQPSRTGGDCTQNACFDPATQTYIASDNTRRVCR